jgi:type IV pilus assembly protein PilM
MGIHPFYSYMFTKNFFKSFPPPAFLEMPSVGVEVSDEAIRFIELKNGKKGLELSRFGEVRLAPGIIEAGYINNTNELTKALSSIRSTHGLNFVTVALPEEKAYLFKTELPAINEKELRESLELKIEENVPISGAEALFEFNVLKNKGHEHNDVLVTVLPRKVVETYIKVFKDAGLVPLSFEAEATAMARSLIHEGDMGTYMIVNFEYSRMGIFVVSEGVVQFTSTLGVDTPSIEKAMNEGTGLKAHELKASLGTGVEATKIGGGQIATLSELRDEIQKVYYYWQSREEGTEEEMKGKERKIEKIFLSGSNSVRLNLEVYFSSALKIPIEVGNVWKNCFSFDHYIPAIEKEQSLSFAVPLGLVLPKP